MAFNERAYATSALVGAGVGGAVGGRLGWYGGDWVHDYFASHPEELLTGDGTQYLPYPEWSLDIGGGVVGAIILGLIGSFTAAQIYYSRTHQ